MSRVGDAAAEYARERRAKDRPADTAPVDWSWMDQAACLGCDPALFFPRKGDAVTERQAKAVCAGCEVREQCLSYALDHSERLGIWGGTSERQRRVLRRRRRSAA